MTVEPNNECIFYHLCVHLQKNDCDKFVLIYIYVCRNVLLLFLEDMLPCILSGPYKWH
jgi:hypothetical protein